MFTPVRVDKTLYRGPQPGSVDDAKLLAALGVMQIINVETNPENSPFEFSQQSDWAKQNGINIIAVPCSIIFPPTVDEMSIVLEFLKDSSKINYIHCREGVDRTGVMCAMYRMCVNNWAWNAAYQEMLQRGFHWGRYFFWPPFIHRNILRILNHA